MKSNLELLVQNAFKTITDQYPDGGFTKSAVRDLVDQDHEFTSICSQVEQMFPHWDLRYSVLHRVSDRISQIINSERDRYGKKRYIAVGQAGREYTYCLLTSLTQPMVRHMIEQHERIRESWAVRIERLTALDELFTQHPGATRLGDFYDDVVDSEALRLFA